MATLPEVSILPIPNRPGVLHLASELAEGFNRGRLEIDCDRRPPRCSVPARRPSWRTKRRAPRKYLVRSASDLAPVSDIVAFADFVSPSLRLKARVWLPEGDNQI